MSTIRPQNNSLYLYTALVNFDQAAFLRGWGRESAAKSLGGGLVFTAVVDHNFFHLNMHGPVHVSDCGCIRLR